MYYWYTIYIKVWYHTCNSKGKNCMNRKLIEEGGCATWYDEPLYLGMFISICIYMLCIFIMVYMCVYIIWYIHICVLIYNIMYILYSVCVIIYMWYDEPLYLGMFISIYWVHKMIFIYDRYMCIYMYIFMCLYVMYIYYDIYNII